MNVLQINSVCGIRSTGRICTDIAEILEKEGHDCKIAYGRESVPDVYQRFAIKIGTEVDVKMHALKSRAFDSAGFESKKATRDFIEKLKDWKPDIIHLHNLHGYYINVPILFDYIKSNNIPVIWTLHDCWAFTGHCTHFDRIGCNKWMNESEGCCHCQRKKDYPKSIFFDCSSANLKKKRKCYNGVKNMTIVTPSRWLAAFIENSILSQFPVKVIPNGIDTTIFRPIESDFRKKYKLENKKIVLGVADGWNVPGRRDDFYHLSELLGDSYKVVMVGFDSKKIHEAPDRVLALPKTNNTKELAEIYTAADVFINPTYEDNYPTINLEAQACGTPVITYRTGGSVENVNPLLIVDKGDVEGLREKVELVNKKDFKMPEGLSIRKEDNYQKYIDLYEKIVSSNR